ncbi:hypothetical protein QE177_12125 [Arsenophonus sp. aPb]|uniref:hypothetical protein n=1 Tax=Arsenophonus sp. aPb TaxID=3041619 RepID=UPI002468AD89|nr:hypothetical protein [Arsenophonus sp. aPb]WGL97925.1 hypothetical protein QE177_12125 [Arsenophonus sp. aPb]
MKSLFKTLTVASLLGLSSFSFAQDGNTSDNKTVFGKAVLPTDPNTGWGDLDKCFTDENGKKHCIELRM